MARRLSWNEKLRRAVLTDGRSIYRWSKDSGLGIGPMQRFAAGQSGLTLESAEKLARLLDWDLRPVAKRKGR
jgi:hypothetical protein